MHSMHVAYVSRRFVLHKYFGTARISHQPSPSPPPSAHTAKWQYNDNVQVATSALAHSYVIIINRKRRRQRRRHTHILFSFECKWESQYFACAMRAASITVSGGKCFVRCFGEITVARMTFIRSIHERASASSSCLCCTPHQISFPR